MIDPVSAMAAGSAAFSAIKRGVQIGRDIESMASDIGRWMNAMSDITEAEKQAKNPPIFKKLAFKGSVEAEAMEAFARKTKMEQQRAELKQWISMSLGMAKWEELIRMEGQIRKERQETIYKQAQRRRKFVEWVMIIFLVLLLSGALCGIIWLLMQYGK
tara:strand:+ start:1253 stop:1729 length:477 start_codon:yes stop_codon:yes gene_type:complete